MAKSDFETYPIQIGYDWSITINDPTPDTENPTFPTGSTYIAHVKQDLTDTNPIGVLDSDTGEIVIIDDNNLQVTIPAALTSQLEAGKLAYFDLVRDDVNPAQHLNIEIGVPVKASVTQV